MLRWLQPRISAKAKFQSKLLVLSFLLHSIVCFSLLFFYKTYDTNLLLKISSVKSEAVVQFVSSMHKKTASATTQMTQQAKSVAASKTTISSKIEKKQPQKKVVKKTVKPMQKPILKQEPKEVLEKKPVIVKTKADEPQVKQESLINPKLQEKKVDPEPVVQQQELVDQQDVKVDVSEQQEIQVLSRQEFEALSLQEALQEAVQEVWAPPAGMDGKLVCYVALTVDWNGKLVEHFIEDSSGVLVFDVAVEQAVAEIQFPRPLWGKSVTVAFTP